MYVSTLSRAAVDAWIEDTSGGDAKDGDSGTSEKLKQVVGCLFERCYRDGEYEHALGVSLEGKRVEMVTEVIRRTPAGARRRAVLEYALSASADVVLEKSFRMTVLDVIASELASGGWGKSGSYAMCLKYLDKAEEVGGMIDGLLKSDEEYLWGYQICFDLVDTGDQNFVRRVSKVLQEDSFEGEELKERLAKAMRILTGGFSSELSLSFLHKQSDSDKLIMENLKKTLEERGGGRNAMLHNCAVMTHAYLNAGTTNDQFLRDHLNWMRKASNWAKFSATASLGVVHAGHTTEAMTLLEPYLPPSPTEENNTVSPGGGYAEGGSLYALGLIHGSHAGSSDEKRKEANDFLRNHLRLSHANEVISHGAALSVGLTAFGTADGDVVNELKELLYTDSAVAGEAAGIGIGLVLAGTGVGLSNTPVTVLDETVAELKNYARETQHEKIIRGIALCLALTAYGQEENADAMIHDMRSDRDPILRYGAQYAIALAYVGTGNHKAIKILLHTAVSDVSDDVRMASVIALAFVLYKTPERVPELVKLLLESFNPHVRYASCMAVGIAMAGSGNGAAISLLEPMLDDVTDFVRQGAILATAMVYMQQSDSCNGKKIKTFREKLISIVGDKHQTTLAKMGAVMATGLIDAGGRNVSLGLSSSVTHLTFTKMTSTVGLVLWLQHWHWYPMMHMLSLALTPTFTIALTKDFKYPKNYTLQCTAKPSLFAYPKRLEEKKEEKKKRVETVTLSTTAKNKARMARKRAKEGDVMDVVVEDEKAEKEKTDAMEVDSNDKPSSEQQPAPVTPTEEPKKRKTPEPSSFTLANPSRTTKSQTSYCSFNLSQRYQPIRKDEMKPYGVIMLRDSTPEEEETDLAAVKTPSVEGEDEAEAPEPFEWAPPGHAEYVEPEVEMLPAESSSSESKDESKNEEEKVDVTEKKE